MVDIEITLSALIDQLFARMTTFLTWRMVFSFPNESKGVWVIVNFVYYSKLEFWVFFKNTIGMSKITTIYIVVEPMVWVSFIFTIS